MLLSSFRFLVWVTALSSIELDICSIIYTFCSFRLLQDRILVNSLNRFLLYAIPIHLLIIIMTFLIYHCLKKQKTEFDYFVSLRFILMLVRVSKIIGVIYGLSILASFYNGVEKGSDLFYSIMLPVCIPFFANLGFASIKRIVLSMTSEHTK